MRGSSKHYSSNLYMDNLVSIQHGRHSCILWRLYLDQQSVVSISRVIAVSGNRYARA